MAARAHQVEEQRVQLAWAAAVLVVALAFELDPDAAERWDGQQAGPRAAVCHYVAAVLWEHQELMSGAPERAAEEWVNRVPRSRRFRARRKRGQGPQREWEAAQIEAELAIGVMGLP